MVAFLFPHCSLEAGRSLNFSITAVFISCTELKLTLSNILIELGRNEVCSLFEIRALLQAPPQSLPEWSSSDEQQCGRQECTFPY